jgi:hemolysin activation/secretion protein
VAAGPWKAPAEPAAREYRVAPGTVQLAAPAAGAGGAHGGGKIVFNRHTVTQWPQGEMSPRSLATAAALLVALVPTMDVLAAEPVRFVVDEIRVTGDNPLPAERVRALIAPFLGEHAGFLELQGAAKTLEEAMAAAGHAFHRVVIPPQKTNTGSIEMQVVAYRIGELTIEGNEHFPDDNIGASLPVLRAAASPNTRALGRALELANRHPVKRVGITVKRSAQPGLMDATLKVTDAAPLEVFTNANNRGSEETGEARLSLGAMHSNLWNADHALTLSYTTSPDHWSDVRQYGVNYSVPLYGPGAELSAFWTRSDVDSGTVAQFFEVSGQGEFHGLRYVQHLLPYGSFRHRVRLSAEDRLFENDVDFRGSPVGVDVRSRPLGVEYLFDLVWPEANLSGRIGVFANAGGGSDNDATAYAASRAGASEDWQALRAALAYDIRFWEAWLVRTRFNAQWAREPLISGEQFGLGGVDSVRGLDEREVAADSAAQLNLELWAPPLGHGLGALVFMDSAYGTREDVQPGERDHLSLISYGLAFRWLPARWLSLSLDYGYVANGEGDTRSGDSRVHFNLFGRL